MSKMKRLRLSCLCLAAAFAIFSLRECAEGKPEEKGERDSTEVNAKREGQKKDEQKEEAKPSNEEVESSSSQGESVRETWDDAMRAQTALVALHEQGKYREAIPYAKRFVEIVRKVKGKEDPNYAVGLNNLAVLYQDMGEYKKALPLFTQALEMKRKLLGDEDPDVAMGLNNLGSLYQDMDEYGKALPLFTQALEMRWKLLGQQHPDVAASLNNLGSLYRDMGEYGKALPLFTQALEIDRKVYGDSHPAVATDMNNLAELYCAMGEYGKALPLHTQALEMRRKLLGDEHPRVATSLNNLASLYQAMGKYGKALPLLTQALEMRRKLLGDEHPDVAASLNNLAELYRAMEDYEKALPLYTQALEILKKAHRDEHPDVATILNNLGLLYWGMGKYEKALPLYTQALEIDRNVYGDSHPAVASDMNNPAALYESMGEYGKALPLYTQALEIWRKAYGDGHPEVAMGLNNLAGLYRAMREYGKALPLYTQALEMAERAESANAFEFASNLGLLFLDMDGPDQATAAFEKAIEGMEEARVQVGGSDVFRARYFSRVRRWEAFEGMIRAQLLLGRPDKALEYADGGRGLALRDVLERAKHMKGGDLLDPVEAKAEAVRDEALLNKVAAARQGERQASSRVNLLMAQINAIGGCRDLTEEERGSRIEPLRAELKQARQAHLAARDVVFNLAVEHVTLDLKSATVGQVQRMLSGSQRLLFYAVNHKDTVLLVASPVGGQVRGFTLKWPESDSAKAVEEDSLGKAVERYVAGMNREGMLARGLEREGGVKIGHDPTEHAALGHRLFQALIPAGLWQELKDAELVYIVPDGVLHKLPFETLIIEKRDGKASAAQDRQYWVDGGPPLVYGPSATVLVNRRAARDRQRLPIAGGGAQRRVATLLGDPIFQRESRPKEPLGLDTQAAMFDRSGYLRRYGSLKPLPGTRREVLEIYRTLTHVDYSRESARKDVPVLLDEDATRARLFAEAPASRYLHLATHGITDTSDMVTYSSLALTQPREVTPDDTGFLTLVDMLDHWWGKLEATELVVLSACDTQRGRIESGEGVIGITWGFMYAGASAVIASLWQVSDESTAELMGNLYREIAEREKSNKPNAKLGAFVAVRKALRKKYPEPYFWAPFIYLGDPR